MLCYTPLRLEQNMYMEIGEAKMCSENMIKNVELFQDLEQKEI